SFFRQEMFCSKFVRIPPRAFFVAIHGQYGSANRKRAGRFGARCPDVAEHCKRIFFFPQAQTCQTKCCASFPVPRFLSDKNLSLSLRRFSCAIRCTEEQSQISILISRRGVIRPKMDNLGCQSLCFGGTSGRHRKAKTRA